MLHHMARRICVLLLSSGALAVLALGALAAPARAHTALESSTPEQGASVASPPTEVTLAFTGPIQHYAVTVAVHGPDGKQFGAGKPEVSGDTVTRPLRPLGPGGTYKIAYRVVSADGHPVSGTLSFTLTAPATPTSAAATSSTPTATEPSPSPSMTTAVGTGEEGGSGGLPAWAYAAGLLVVVSGAGTAVWVWRRAGRGT